MSGVKNKGHIERIEPFLSGVPADADSAAIEQAVRVLEDLAAVFFQECPANQPTNHGPFGNALNASESNPNSGNFEAMYRILAEQIPAVVFLAYLDQGFGQAYVSPHIETVLGFSQEEWLNDPVRWFRQLHPEDKQRWSMEAAQMFLSGAPLQSTYRVMARDGHVVWFQCDARMIRHEDGRPWLVHGVAFDVSELKESQEALARDIEERRRLEQQFFQAQKMESIGTLAGGIAHHFNNILNILQAHTFLLRERSFQAEDMEEILGVINDTIKRSALVQQILTVARKSSSTLELLNANPVIDGLGVLLGQTFSKTIELRLSLEPGLPAIMADRNQIEQALLNLCVNARDAMPEGGRLVLKTWSVPGESVRHPDANADKRYVCVEVTDTGMGMDESVQKRIFEPFFTTKEIGQGTGLGLSVVYGIVRHHDGFIDVESRPMSGTSFRLYFPVYHSQRSAEKPSVNFDTNAKAASNTAATVLIVEDEKNIVYAMERILQKRGYKVMVASDGEMAVEIYRRDKEKIDVVLLDMGLPKLTGRDVLRAIKDENPAVKVIVASGYIEPELESEIERYGAKFLHKPYMLDEVFNKIQGFVEEAG